MKNLITLSLYILMIIPVCGQIGINTSTPQETLHVNGSFQITNELSVGGDEQTKGDPGEVGQILISKGEGHSPIWSDFTVPEPTPATNGSIIALDGNFVIAQEIAVQLSEDFNFTATTLNTPIAIPNLSTIIMDNRNTYTSDANGNSFTVKEDGVYEVIMNFMIQGAAQGSSPVIGIWDDTNNTWIARVNDAFNVDSAKSSDRNQTYTLITTTPFSASNTYSFRVTNTSTLTIKSTSSGTTGEGNVSMIIVKRLK